MPMAGSAGKQDSLYQNNKPNSKVDFFKVSHASTRQAKAYGETYEDHLKALAVKQNNSKSSKMRNIIKNAKKTAKEIEIEKYQIMLDSRERERQIYIQNHLQQERENLQKHNESNTYQDPILRQSSNTSLFKNQYIYNAEDEEKNKNNSLYFNNIQASPIKKDRDHNINFPGDSHNNQGNKQVRSSPVREKLKDVHQKSLIIQELIGEQSQSQISSAREKINKKHSQSLADSLNNRSPVKLQYQSLGKSAKNSPVKSNYNSPMKSVRQSPDRTYELSPEISPERSPNRSNMRYTERSPENSLERSPNRSNMRYTERSPERYNERSLNRYVERSQYSPEKSMNKSQFSPEKSQMKSQYSPERSPVNSPGKSQYTERSPIRSPEKNNYYDNQSNKNIMMQSERISSEHKNFSSAISGLKGVINSPTKNNSHLKNTNPNKFVNTPEKNISTYSQKPSPSYSSSRNRISNEDNKLIKSKFSPSMQRNEGKQASSSREKINNKYIIKNQLSSPGREEDLFKPIRYLQQKVFYYQRSPVRSPIRSPVRSPERSPKRNLERSPVRSPNRNLENSPVRSSERIDRSPIRSLERSLARSPIRNPVNHPVTSPIRFNRPDFSQNNKDYFKEADQIFERQAQEIRRKRDISPLNSLNKLENIPVGRNVPLIHAKKILDDIKDTHRLDAIHYNQQSLNKTQKLRNRIERLSEVLVDKYNIRGIRPAKSVSPPNISRSHSRKKINTIENSPKLNNNIVSNENAEGYFSDNDILTRPKISTLSARERMNSKNSNQVEELNINKSIKTRLNDVLGSNNYRPTSSISDHPDSNNRLTSIDLQNERELYKKISQLISGNPSLYDLKILKLKVRKMVENQSAQNHLTDFEEKVVSNLITMIEEKERNILNQENTTHKSHLKDLISELDNIPRLERNAVLDNIL